MPIPTPAHMPGTSGKVPSTLVQHREPTQPICGNQSLPEASLGPSCILWGAWASAFPPCPHRDSSPSPGGGLYTPQRVCNRYPTCPSHTACTGREGCRGSGARGGTGTANSSPAERGQAVRRGRGQRVATEHLWADHVPGSGQGLCLQNPIQCQHGGTPGAIAVTGPTGTVLGMVVTCGSRQKAPQTAHMCRANRAAKSGAGPPLFLMTPYSAPLRCPSVLLCPPLHHAALGDVSTLRVGPGPLQALLLPT